ncbi:hypothetical protein [Roseivivax isoporae]|uniref:Uncharacterized protein n=1 Tax=Roseivivax isoporae LMG 25204 TaxID=1449351 RepID=X7FAP7_9RHOB|nr:hypothetical protein [Roseivivax isoporae]ETX29176.1 hypothetical protein RISW2_02820 [Roseivivax isoporae LMG 25204]
MQHAAPQTRATTPRARLFALLAQPCRAPADRDAPPPPEVAQAFLAAALASLTPPAPPSRGR